LLRQLELDQAGSPGRVEAFELAGLLKDGGGAGRGGPCAGMIAGGEPGRSVRAVEAPDLPDGVIGQVKFGGDRGEVLTQLVTADDLLTERDGQGTRHGSHSWSEIPNPLPMRDLNHENPL
jgi:hypothetical protein